ncbi:MAG: CDP-paratose 2-epimerase [Acidobacteria bacterium]|nr:CDP-paratose 2-epimerase [Acidobacteriota bacterium]
MKDRVFTAEQLVPRPREEVFAFFSEPRNLEAITPPWLGFRIVDQTTNEVEAGTELTYRLRIHGLPVTWRSRIDEWQPNERFVDVQLKGPYAKWHHTHSFHDRGDGTLIRDRVVYRLPMGRLGHWIGGRFVASDVEKIFAYRAAKTNELLIGGSAGGST